VLKSFGPLELKRIFRDLALSITSEIQGGEAGA